MAKTRYKYNPETLSYEVVEPSTGQRVWKIMSYVTAGLVFAFVSVVIAYIFFPSPNEKKQERRLAELQGNYNKLHKKMAEVNKVLDDLQERDDNIYRTIFEAEPLPEGVRNGGIGGVNRYREIETLEDGVLIAKATKRLDSLTKRMYIQSVSFDEVIRMAREKEKLLASIPGIQPIANKDLKRMASGFGHRIHPVYKTWKMHAGMDFSAPSGTEIYATGDGIVEIAKQRGNGYGRYVVINHGYSYKTLYAHCSKILVKKGQKIKRGHVIGLVGSTGTSIAPHLHYEVIKNGVKINPINFYFNDLSPAEFEQMILLSSSANQSFD